jgi:hypothetical protein
MKNILIFFGSIILLAAASVYYPIQTDATLTGAGTVEDPLKIDTTKIATKYYSGSLTGGGASYDVYTALITQEGTDAPEATILENTIGTITYDYITEGEYTATCTGCFTLGKTIVIVKASENNYTVKLSALQVDADQINLYTWTIAGAGEDDVMESGTYYWIEIRVYE